MFFTDVIQGHCSHEDGMQCLLDFLGKKKSTLFMYSCKILQIKKFTSDYLMQKLLIPCYGGTEKIPLNCTSSVIGFCPFSTDYKYSVLESCLFTNVIEFPEIKKQTKPKRVLRSQATKPSQHLSQVILNVEQFKAEH